MAGWWWMSFYGLDFGGGVGKKLLAFSSFFIIILSERMAHLIGQKYSNFIFIGQLTVKWTNFIRSSSTRMHART